MNNRANLVVLQWGHHMTTKEAKSSALLIREEVTWYGFTLVTSKESCPTNNRNKKQNSIADVARVIGGKAACALFAALADHCTLSLGNSVKVCVDELAPTPAARWGCASSDQSRAGWSSLIGPVAGVIVSDLQLQNTLNSGASVCRFPSSLQVSLQYLLYSVRKSPSINSDFHS